MGKGRQIFLGNAKINQAAVILISWRIVLQCLRRLALGYVNTCALLKAGEDILSYGGHSMCSALVTSRTESTNHISYIPWGVR